MNIRPGTLRKRFGPPSVVFGLVDTWLIFATLVTTAFGANTYWTGLTGGDFTNQPNWSTLAVPTAADATYFTNNAVISVLIDSAVTNSDATIDSLAGSLGMNITVGSSWFTTNTLTVGNTAGFSATLSLTNGGTALVGGSVFIGGPAGVTGTVILTGGQLVTTNSAGTEVTYVGNYGVGNMTMSNGTWLANQVRVGANTGSGTLNLNGGTNVLANAFYIANNAGGTGAVNITGGQLVTTNSAGNDTTYVGFGGVGNMTVSNGMWLVDNINVGNSAGSSGTLNLNGGGNVLANGFFVANNAGATGAVNITGGQLVTTNSAGNDNTYVGNNGVGNMTVSNGTWLANQVRVGAHAGSSGTLAIAGGTNWFNNTTQVGIAAGATGTVNVTGGILVITNTSGTAQLVVGASGLGSMTLSGGTVIANQLLVTNGASSSFSASGGSLAAGSATIGGSLSLTNSTGTISGDLTVTPSGSLSGTNGVFALFRNGIIQSTNQAQFNLTRSMVLFTNGAGVSAHTLSLSNSLAVEMGPVGTPEIQTLRISLSNSMTLTGMKSGPTTNALYAGWLDLSAWNTNAGVSLTNTLQAALTLPDINLYYDASDTRNAYLQDASYALWGGGGLLIPIPEPSTLALVGCALALAAVLRRHRDGIMWNEKAHLTSKH